ncbi:hypothetical protein CLV35_3716 [Motilibacter peucedani]|uniref:Uncharacterized protein n=1 Tax=Motilibacter peucedani TaxID=598650 RepID=A0A420XL03_9ACTN|nr:gephyrin-like molybdotransferase receptor GlpR [Motilibacter peucedani]RKS68588.1 hypothetical protein CLV35_3716 [Motilibacter peucedani]
MTGLIFGTIVAAWAAVLVPMWLRRHDERNEARSVERFSSAMRVLSRRGPATSGPAAPGRRAVVMPARPRVADVHVTGPSRERRPIVPLRTVRTATTTAPTAGRSTRVTSQPRPARRSAPLAPVVAALGRLRPRAPRSTAPVSLVVRRRRTLVGLAALLLVVTVAWLLGPAPVWLPVLALLALVGYVVHLRAQARVSSEAARRRAAVEQRTAARAARRSSTDRVRRARAAGIPVPEAVDEATLDEMLDDGWDPREVPLPTYVAKSAAPRLPDADVAAFWGDPARDDESPLPVGSPAPAPAPVDEADEALDDELGAILERRRVVGE